MVGRIALHQDIVETVVKKLNSDTRKIITKDIIVKTQEQMRLMQIKANRTLNQIDTSEIRAAILLDYVVREVKGTRLDHKSLLQALGINGRNKAKFSALHDMIGNYRAPEPSKEVLKGSRPSKYPLRQSASQVPTENSVPRLAIRLSSLIPDPNGFAFKAKQLFEEIQDFVRTLEMPRRSDQLKDIERFWTCYEAACLYHVVAKTQTKKLYRVSKPNKQKQSSGKDMEDMLNRSLEMDDILKACPNFSARDFQEVCKHVGGMVTQMEEANEKAAEKKKAENGKASRTEKTKKKRGRNSTTSADAQADEDKPSKSRKENGEAEAPSGKKDPAEPNNDKSRDKREYDDDVSIPSLHDWRDQVLKEARERAKKELSAAGMAEEEMNETKLLAHAADAVLKQYGLLV